MATDMRMRVCMCVRMCRVDMRVCMLRVFYYTRDSLYVRACVYV